ncbi:hypothetical protein RND71_008738 [Anisodus tanguticus]|uniref:Uncharacterized protein n=1 Tax=Anisodus tanguticus TaxID=243964 RepID=A0AAE1SP91_9SOLA|nr:hypothetical protein RND71_008738 [Anisodus tanguticus]
MAHLELLIPWRGSTKRPRNSHASSSYPKGNFGGNQLLDGSISLSPLYPSQTNDLHVSIAAGLHRVSSGFAPLRHSSPSFGSRQVCSHSNPSQKIKVGRRCTPRGDPTNQLPYALRVYSPVDSHTCQTPWSVFQDGSNGEPTGQRPERADAEARRRARAACHNRGDGVPRAYREPGLWPPPQSTLVHAPSRSADRLVAVPHPPGAHRRPPSASLPTISSTL